MSAHQLTPNKLAIVLSACLGSALSFPALAADTDTYWHDREPASSTAVQLARTQAGMPSRHRALDLDFQALRRLLTAPPAAHNRGTANRVAAKQPSLRVNLPLPDGGFSEFTLADSGVMPDELARRYPNLRSFRGSDTAGRLVRLDLSATSLQASVQDEHGRWIVQPEPAASPTPSGPVTSRYMSFHRGDMPMPEQPFELDDIRIPSRDVAGGLASRAQAAGKSGGGILYNFRFAVTANSAYTAKFGGTVEGGLSGVVRAVNQVNELYENDLGIHLTLIADSDKLIMTDPATDPFESVSGLNELFAENINLLNRVVGEANYDVGILVTDEFGGNAGALGNTCVEDVSENELGAHKAAGWTGHPNPVGDPLFVDIMAHELGHKFGAWHIFNGCNKPTLDDRAFEPGSGSTIMGYPGTGCGGDAQQLQNRMDRYFNAANVNQIGTWLASRGGQCAARRLNPNSAAWIDPESVLPFGSSPPTIPAHTPFSLSATAIHGNPLAKLTYTWEQMDIGPQQEGALTDSGTGPIFRSYQPAASGERVFPRMAAVLGDDTLGLGEVYPRTTRDLNFRLTVRDNFGPLATTAGAAAKVTVVDTGAAFAVTAPNDIVSWKAGTQYKIRWNVAGTNKAPISCQRVDVHLSLDGGYHYLEVPLARAVRNRGSADIILPALANSTSLARLRVKCSDNIFFAVSPTNFVIRK